MILLIDHKYVSIIAIQVNLLIPMNMCVNGFIIDEYPKLLNQNSKYTAHAVITQYHMEYNLPITLKFSD